MAQEGARMTNCNQKRSFWNRKGTKGADSRPLLRKTDCAVVAGRLHSDCIVVAK